MSSVVKACFFQLCEFQHTRGSIPNLLSSHLPMPLYILALIIVIVFFMVSQGTLLITYKKYKTSLFVLLHIPLVLHILLQFSSLYISYLLNTILILNCCIMRLAFLLGEPHYIYSLLVGKLNSHSFCSFSFNPFVLAFFNKISNCFRSFVNAAPFFWNHLLNNVCSILTYSSSKKP